MANRPEPEIDLSEPFVRSLLAAQHPEVADLPLRMLSRGWDNTNYRLGDELLVRLPHREVAAQLILHEQQWLPPIAERVDLGVPSPTNCGVPSDDYPWPWSIVPFFDGDEAAGATLNDDAVTATRLGQFFAQLHIAAPNDAPPNPYRGGPLAERVDAFHTRINALTEMRSAHDLDAMTAVFLEAVAVEPSAHRVWLHADLHARNMVIDAGDLVAAIDWGDICAGDAATDLAAAYMLVPDAIDVVQAHANADEATWQRARGWAMSFAVIYLAHSDDDPVMGAIGDRLVAVLLA